MKINRFLVLAFGLSIFSLPALGQVYYPPNPDYFTHVTVPMESAPVVTYDSPTTRPVAPTIPPNAAHGLEESSAIVVPAPRNTPAAAVRSTATITTTPAYSYRYGSRMYHYGTRVERPGRVVMAPRFAPAQQIFPAAPGTTMPVPVNDREAPRGAFTRFLTTPPTISFTDELPVIVTISY